ncbi:MAG: tRNA (N(6)-L-threonylcarbamoyladenosine(37)-C(2))-methylthiotransferase MtaB [Gammaproteobacteria bacterium]|nr:tRNA (N(6)-L-threonylcarbamoyladenosine(37)-C(2))-methylthiotransferase MtaB [Gammaproteobacteria bacterium]
MNSISVRPPAKPSFASSVVISTMGCKVNAFESEMIAEKLERNAIQRVQSVEDADLFIINTCTVTAEADRQARQLIRRAIRQNPRARIVVTGCYAQMDPDACAQIPGVDLVVGNSQKLDIPALVEDLCRDRLPPVLLRDIDREISLPEQLLKGYQGKSRAFVQIQQGCDQGCTFCIIHVARGPSRSFPPASVRRQCERLLINGYGEIVLCGVDVGSYGADIQDSEVDLAGLIRALANLEGDYRIRLSSIDPAHITDELVELLRQSGNICPHLHLSLQSANTLILKRMKRRARRSLVYDRITALRSAIPELVLSADILAGFPTESDAHFEDTLTAIEELEIAYPHVFTYSSRPGTPAARIPDQVPKSVRQQRANAARRAGRKVWRRVARRQVGQTKRVLLEHCQISAHRRDLLFARADNYFPVQIKCDSRPESPWLNVTITGVGTDTLLA